MAPAAKPPTMPSPTPQPRQPAWASLGTETAASANTPAAAIAVIVVFMFLPHSGMIALRSFDFTQVFSNHSNHPSAGTGYLACPQAAVRPLATQTPTPRAGIRLT